MEMAGLILHPTGWLAQEEWQMHGPKILLNGMIQTEMAVVTILQAQLPMFVLLILELLLDPVQVGTVGAVQIPTEMVGPT
jgi:hypothetical protein